MGVTPEQLAQTLVGRHAEQRRRARERAEALFPVVRREVSELVADGVVRRAWLIGSLAWGAFGAGSDVDIVVEGLAVRDAPAIWDRLSSRLGTAVDLLQIESLDQDFAHRVRSEGVLLNDR